MKGFILALSTLLALSAASVGDRQPAFKNCVSSCESITCGSNPETSFQLPLHLRLLFWDCSQNCDYNCQRINTKERLSQGLDVVQYHGKWPFIRMYGIQEPASVLFSVLNFIPHFQGLHMLLRSEINVPMKKFYVVFALIGMNAWIWSSVFHIRDFVLTERLDYFSAGLTILYGFYSSTVRLCRLDLPEKSTACKLFTAFCVGVFVCHVGYLSLIRFSYTYNMAFGVVVGMIQNILWSYHAFRSYKKLEHKRHRAWTLWPFYIVTAITAGMTFELFDFPPVSFVLDAHALWHAATVVPTYWWYKWMKRDLNYLQSQKIKA